MNDLIEVGDTVSWNIARTGSDDELVAKHGDGPFIVTEIQSGLIFISHFKSKNRIPFKAETEASSDEDRYGWPEEYLALESI